MKEFQKPGILKLAKRIAARSLCDNCLGRQFARVSTGMTNRERGDILRRLIKAKEPKRCEICNNLFKSLEKYSEEALRKLEGIRFKTFVVGTKLSPGLVEKEESLWSDFGIEHCEPIKAELNRELGKLIEKKSRKGADETRPDINIILNLNRNGIDVKINPFYVYGKYKKLIRGIPQTKWDKYPETVEDIIAAPFMKASKGSGHSMHASGREDIDARCLDWRPFVFEISEPRKRELNLKKIQSSINKTKKVNVTDLRFSDRKEVVRVKDLSPDKTYRVLAVFEKDLNNLDILNNLCGIISQETPKRVLHRRADKVRKKKVKSIKWKKISNKKLELEIKGEAGLYIKELVTGDEGRTKSSVSEILKNQARVLELDVVKIWL